MAMRGRSRVRARGALLLFGTEEVTMRNLAVLSGILGCISAFALLGCGSNDSGPSSPAQAGQAGQNGALGEAGAATMNGKDGTNGTNGVDGTNGTNGVDGTNGKDGSNGSNGADGKTSLINSSHELAGDNCAYGGVRIESGIDQNGDGKLSNDEVDAAQTQFVCNVAPAWPELAALPTVANAYSFALATNDQDGSARLGFMFKDDAYRAQLLAQGGVLWDGGGVYSGAWVFGVYKLGGETGKVWQPYQGRLTPQYYQYSELAFSSGDSYYTTSYPSFGGLVSVIKNGQGGAYALTPAFTTRKAHSVGFLGGQLFALIAQKAPGLTLSTYPADQVGSTLSNLWQNLVTIEADASTVTDPTLLAAGDELVLAYAINGNAVVRASNAPGSAALPADLPVIAQVTDAVHLSVAWDSSELYLATVSSSGALTVQRAALGGTPSWEVLSTRVTGAVSDISLAGKTNSVLLGVRQTNALRVYLSPTEALPSFDAVLPGNFSLINAASGPTLALLDLDASAAHTLRSFAP
jgi:hypothetical protein